MARPKSDGLSYFPFDVDFFQDPKIRAVRAHYGADGVALYLYLLCEIYRNSYFVKVDEDFIDCTAADLGMSVDKTRQMISFFCKRSLFSDKLFMADTVLTAKSVQHRYQEARKGAKRDVFVEGKLWLLEKAETLGFIKVRPFSDFSEKNEDFSEKNPDKSAKNATKESKVKERKGKESKAEPPRCAPDSEITRADLVGRYGEQAVSKYEQRFESWREKRGAIVRNRWEIIAKWLSEDGVQPAQYTCSFDVDEVVESIKSKYRGGQSDG